MVLPCFDEIAAPLGGTGLTLAPLGLGGAPLGGMYEPVPTAAAVATVERAHELGIRHFDTAPLYGHGHGERCIGRALAGIDRSSIVLATKVGVVLDPERSPAAEPERHHADPFAVYGRYDFGYDACLASLEASMERLGTDRIDIVYVHDPDEADSLLPPARRSGADHFAEVMDGAYRALHELRDQDVIGAIGVGLNGTELLIRFASAGDFDCFLLAGRYTLLEQNGLDDLLPLCDERGISIVAGAVFNSGILATGTAVPAPTYNYEPADAATIERVAAIEAVCREHDVPLAAAALQFPLAAPAVVAVIPGMRSAAEVEENVQRMACAIPPAFWQALKDKQLLAPGACLPPRRTHD